MRICLIGELKNAAKLKMFASIFGYRKDEVVYVKRNTYKRYEDIAWETFSNIDISDTVIILPGTGCNFNTIYEMTYARKLGKEILSFNKKDELVDISKFTEEDYDNLFY